MKSFRSIVLACACLAPPASGSAAQPSVLDASLPSPVIQYRSAFEDYRPYREAAAADWRAVNDEVGRIGGHVGIFRSPAAARGQPPERGAPKAPGTAGHSH